MSYQGWFKFALSIFLPSVKTTYKPNKDPQVELLKLE